MKYQFIRVLFIAIFCAHASSGIDTNDDPNISFGVCLTTIPLRFSSIHHTVASWLQQTVKPQIILVFIPQRYKNFDHVLSSSVESIKGNFRDYFPLDKDRVVVEIIPEDWGPASKISGLLYHFKKYSYLNIKYWAVGDDDVWYSKTTLSRYADFLSTSVGSSNTEFYVITHFKKEKRIGVRLRGKEKIRALSHIQGVDTFIIPQIILEYQYNMSAPLSYHVFTRVLSFYFQTCPSTFYQDDYIISFLLYLAGLRVISIWNGEKVANHVDNVSTSNEQMHRHANVFKREEDTKRCIAQTSLLVERMVLDETVRNKDFNWAAETWLTSLYKPIEL